MLKFIWKFKKPTMGRILLNKNEMRELALSEIKTYNKVGVIKIAWHRCTHERIYKCNKLESSETEKEDIVSYTSKVVG